MNTINKTLFTNNIEITQVELESRLEKGEIEAYTQENINNFLKSLQDTIQKSDNETSLDVIKAELNNLQKIDVVGYEDTNMGRIITKTPMWIQETMIEKGLYKDNVVNRKLGRVGKKFGGEGEKKEENKD